LSVKRAASAATPTERQTMEPHTDIPASRQPQPPPVQARFLLLIVDLDTDGANALAATLQDHSIDAVVAGDPVDAVRQASALLPDAVLIDSNAAAARDSALARALQARAGIPMVIGLNDCGKPSDGTVLDGAFACVSRPYRLSELLPLLRSISPDPHPERQVALEVGALHLDPAANQVRLRGKDIGLALREFQLLHLLMLHAGRVVTRAQIRQLVWSRDDETSNTITAHIRRLRARLGDDLNDPKIIVSVRGLGYRLDPPPTDA
jgi:DNA-binding response OmpR family regulator